jgi:NAD(P)-dependent dehydrogenase (short-subunit alcohol dehydrogenase family)
MKKTILITGATSGIGYEAAKEIAKSDCTLVFTARDAEKAEKTKAAIIAYSGNTHIDYLLVDFDSFDSIRQMVLKFTQTHSQLDVLVNNAGVWEMERKASKDGIEMNFAVNYLAPFLLTNLLLPLLKKSEAGRIVNTSSMAHRRNILMLHDLEYKNQAYDGVATYSQSKLCNLLFTLHLQEILKNTPITANTVHPGYVQTNLFNNMGGERDWRNVPSAYDGARSTIYAALSPELVGVSGKYFYHEGENQPTDMALDKNLAHQLWDKSVEYVEAYL